MNIRFLLVLSLAGTACAQVNLESRHLDRLSPKVREFVEKYKAEKANKKINSDAQKRKVVLKSDVLGRKVKRGQVQDSTVYLVEDVIEPRMEVTVADLSVEDVDIEPISAQYSYNGEKKEENFLLNGKKIDKKSFFKKTEDWEKRRIKKQKPLKQSYRAFLTPTEMENKLLSSEDIYIEDGDESYIRKAIQPMEVASSHLPQIFIKDSAVEAICQGAKLGAGGIAKLSKDIQKGNLVAIKSLKGELVAAGTSLFSSQEIMNADSGLVVDTNKVFMDTGIYPKGW